MAEIDNNLKTGNTLLDLTYENTYINYYITNQTTRLIESGDNGDLIIYVSDGTGVFDQDRKRETDLNNTYTDIYVGNEHIAGGFGFKDIETRNNVLSDIINITKLEEEHYLEVKQELTYISNSKINPVTINETKRFIQLDNGDEYELKMNSRNEISLVKNHRITINDIEIVYLLNNETEERILKLSDKTKFVSTFDDIKIVGFNVITESSDYVKSFNLAYVMPKFDKNMSIGIDKTEDIGSTTADELCVSITDINYKLSEDEKYVWLSTFKERFEQPITIKCYNNLNYDIKFRLIARTENYDSAVIYTPSFKFIHPIYYFVYENYTIPVSITEIPDVKTLIEYNFNENIRLKFNHINESYGFVLIPRYWYDLGYRPEFYFYDQLSIRTTFNYGDIETNSLTINDQNYIIYRTPNKYKNGLVEWDLNLRSVE